MVRRTLQDPEGFVPPYQRIAFERGEQFALRVRKTIKRAETLFDDGNERLGSVYANSRLDLVSSKLESRASVDWALIKIIPPRSSSNQVSIEFF